MSTLSETLLAPATRPRVIRACEQLVEAEVSSKSGLSGMAIKAAFKVIQTIKPGIMGEVIERLLPEFTDALEPMFREAVERAGTAQKVSTAFAERLQADPGRVADALLRVTDAKAERAANKTIKSTYEKLRKVAREHVSHAVPALARTVAPFVDA